MRAHEPVFVITPAKRGSDDGMRPHPAPGRCFGHIVGALVVLLPLASGLGAELRVADRLPLQSLGDTTLTWYTPEQVARNVAALAALPAPWYREFSFTPSAMAQEIDGLRQVQAQGKRLLLVLTPDPADYDPPPPYKYAGDPKYRSFCGSSRGMLPLSGVDPARLAKRLAATLGQLKAAGISLGAVEIGNELDQVCFNGDLPVDRPGDVPEDQLLPYAEAYARFLDTAVDVIKQPRFYPDARILTFGTSNTIKALPDHAFQNDGMFISLLRNIAGKNLLSQVDAFAVHMYPDPRNDHLIAPALQTLLAQAGETKPIWITEWGYATSYFNDAGLSPNGRTRLQAYRSFYHSVVASGIEVENMFNFSLATPPWNVIEPDGTLGPEAAYFTNPNAD